MDFLKPEETKTTTSAKVEGRFLKLGDYRFALSKHSGDDQRVIRISMEEIENLNDKYEVSTSILDFVLQSKHDDFMKKGVKVLPTRVLRDIMGSDQNQGQILQDAVRGSVFDYKALVLPYISEERWDLFVLFNPRILFNQAFQKLSPNIVDLVQSVSTSAKKQKKKKKKIKARIAHISSHLDQSEEFESTIYKTLNAHFEVVYPGEKMETYLSTGTSITPDNCLAQPLTIKHKEGHSDTSGGYLIYSFLSQVFLKDKSLTPDLRNIEYNNWFSNIDGELDEIKIQLKEIPGTRIVEKDGQVTVTKRDSFFLNTPERASSTELVSPLKLESVKPFLEQEQNAIKKEDVIAEDGPEDSERDASQLDISKDQLANVIDVEITDQLKTKEDDWKEEVKKETKVIEIQDAFSYEEPKAKPQTPPPTQDLKNKIEDIDLTKSETCPPGLEGKIETTITVEEEVKEIAVPVESVPVEKKVVEIEDAFAYDMPAKPKTPPPSENTLGEMVEKGEELMKSETCPPGKIQQQSAGIATVPNGVTEQINADFNSSGAEVPLESLPTMGIVEVENVLPDQIPTKTQTPPPLEQPLDFMVEKGEELIKSETCPPGLENKLEEAKLEAEIPAPAAPKEEILEMEDAFAYDPPANPTQVLKQEIPQVTGEELLKSETCPPGLDGVQGRFQVTQQEFTKSVSLKGQGAQDLLLNPGAGIPAAEVQEKLQQEIKNETDFKAEIEPFKFQGQVPDTPHPSEDLGALQGGVDIQAAASIAASAQPEIIEDVEIVNMRDSQNFLESEAPTPKVPETIDSGLGMVLDKGDGMLEYQVDGTEANENKLNQVVQPSEESFKLGAQSLNFVEPDLKLESEPPVEKEDIEIKIDKEESELQPREDVYHELISEQISKEVHLPQDQDFQIPVTMSAENTSAVELTQERVVYGEIKDERKDGEENNPQSDGDGSSTPSPRKSIKEVTSGIQMRLRQKGIVIQSDYQPAKLLSVQDSPTLHRTPSEEKLSLLEKVTPGNNVTIKTETSYLSPPAKKKLEMEKRKHRGEISYDETYSRRAGCCSGCSIF